MTPETVTPFLYAVAVLSWVSAITLLRLAGEAPHPIPVTLRERAATGVVIALFVSVYAVLAASVDAGFTEASTSRVLLRLAAVVLGLIPVWWLILYARRFR